MTWHEPNYKLFDPKTGLIELMDKVKDAKCFIICYEENALDMTAGIFRFFYRRLWTYNFTGDRASLNFAVIIDDKIAGVFGFTKTD